jgi:hypothetical protein
MNRIILIGNGFDLAHGLKTSYADFIDWYWDKRILDLHSIYSNESKDVLCSLKLMPNTFSQWQSFYWSNQNVLQNTPGKDIIKQLAGDKTNYKIAKSDFFSCILLSYQEKGWVDIENEYYRLLFPSEDKGPFLYRDKPKELNEELAYVRSLLIEYLKSIQENCINEGVVKQDLKDKLYTPFKPNDISINAKPKLVEFIRQRFLFDSTIRWDSFSDWEELLKAYDVEDIIDKKMEIKSFVKSNRDQVDLMGIESIANDKLPNGFLFPDRVMLLNFNYTTTADSYLLNNERFIVNHIHGKLTKPRSVIFGYGDEIDENYKKIANKNDNEYLTNIKSIKYLESPNYRNLLDFIESDAYQIFIMGHSCGNSDRTLLNTLFEHKNCVSIKPFYFIRKDGTDNYMELVQNISRNFTDMKLMRDRVVNKTFCEPYSDASKMVS